MSTRAIIGIKNADGTITGGWQWSDGMGLVSLLREQFDTLEKVQELIRNGVWSTMVSPKDTGNLKRFTEWTERKDSCYYLVLVGKCHLLKEKPSDTAKFCFGDDYSITVNEDGSMTFADFKTAKGQDINYLYLFYPESCEWKVFP